MLNQWQKPTLCRIYASGGIDPLFVDCGRDLERQKTI